MKRTFRINFKNGFLNLEIAKAACVDTKNSFISVEKMKDGKFRLIWSKDLIEDFTKVVSFEIIRED